MEVTRDKVYEEVRIMVNRLNFIDVSIHDLMVWFNPDSFWNRRYEWFFGRDIRLNLREYRQIANIIEQAASLKQGIVGVREGIILEKKTPTKRLTHISSPKALEVIEKLFNDYWYCKLEKYRSSLGFLEKSQIYLTPTLYKERWGPGCSIHIKGINKIENEFVRNIASKLIRYY